MTEKQKFKLYFPEWRKVCEANGYRNTTRKERGCFVSTHPSEWTAKVEVFAKQRAESRKQKNEGQRGVTLDDLRHGAHWVALGRDKSSEHLTNAELDRVITLFKLLIDKDNIDAGMAWDNSELGERKRLKWSIEHAAPHAYIDAICRDKFPETYDGHLWDILPIEQLRQLAVTLKYRRKRKAESRNFEGNKELKLETVAVSENEPF